MDTDMQNLPEKKIEHYSQASTRLVRALVGSFVSLFISVFAFSALTFAYFSDTSTVSNNMIVSGSNLPGAPYTGQSMHHLMFADAEEQKNSFSSSWAAAYDGWCQNLDCFLGIFDNLE